MQYFILPTAMFVFFWIMGQVITKKYHIHNFVSNAVIGFGVFLGVYFVVCVPLVLMHAKFYITLTVTLMYICFWIIYIFKNRLLLSIENNPIYAIIFLIFTIQLFFALQNSIGSLSLYDTINYTNLVTGNIYLEGLNTFEMTNGYSGSLPGYAFQSYYILASVLYYLVNGFCSKANISFFYFTQHTWFYSVLLYAFFSEMIINFAYEFKYKNKISYIFIFIFVLIFMGNFYWNSEQAYLGNSFRMTLISYSLFYLKEYFETHNKNSIVMLGLLNYANCACANSNTTLTIILIFGIWLFTEDDVSVLRILILSLCIPVFTMLYQMTRNALLSLLAVVALAVLCIFSKQVIYITRTLKLKVIIPIIVLCSLIVSSFMITGNIFDFDAFLNNWSGWSDMTWDYTDFSVLWRVCANIVYLFLMGVVLYKDRNDKVIKTLTLIALVFFNPFASPVQNKYMPVFYRNYDIVINYFTIFWAVKETENLYKDMVLNNVVMVLLCLISTYSAYNQIIYHPNDSFNKPQGYNNLLRMTNDEANTILFTKDYVLNENLGEVKVISSILQIHTEMPKLKTLYGRNKVFNGIKDEWELYKVFYHSDYYEDPYAPESPDYNAMCGLISDSKYELIIQDKRIEYYDENSNTYYSIIYLINECGSYPIYENDTYAVYRYRYE